MELGNPAGDTIECGRRGAWLEELSQFASGDGERFPMDDRLVAALEHGQYIAFVENFDFTVLDDAAERVGQSQRSSHPPADGGNQSAQTKQSIVKRDRILHHIDLRSTGKLNKVESEQLKIKYWQLSLVCQSSVCAQLR